MELCINTSHNSIVSVLRPDYVMDLNIMMNSLFGLNSLSLIVPDHRVVIGYGMSLVIGCECLRINIFLSFSRETYP